MKPRLSIIIPVLNEEDLLEDLLSRLGTQEDIEIIVVDGGSTDKSLTIARESSAGVIRSAPGRARQMNAGAMHSSSSKLLFLHADTELSLSGIDAAIAALESHQWGRFDVDIRGVHWLLPVVAAGMNLRSRLSGIATGDQAIFTTRAFFFSLNGFPDQPLMEDVEFCRRARTVSRPACLRERVLTSGRRWERRGICRTIMLMWRLRWLYWRGVPATHLARLYR